MDEVQIVVFKLGEEEYGMDIMKVQEIIRPPQTTKLPGAPAHEIGVCNLRGKIVPIIDLRSRFGLEKSENNEDTRVIIKKHDNQYQGLIVDGVNEVLKIGSDCLESVGDVSRTVENQFITGIARIGERLIIILNSTADI